MENEELLRALRDRVLEEEQTVPALLRLCLMLGQRSGSHELRAWAHRELHGYGPQDRLPAYRSISDPPLFADSVGGFQIARNQMISRWVIPEDLREMLPSSLDLRQPVDELEAMATGASGLSFTHEALTALAVLWSSRQGPMVERIYFVVANAQIAGIVGRVRNLLVELVADLTSDLEFDNVPERRKVDSSVKFHMYGGDHNEIHVNGSNSGVIGAGHQSQQTQNVTAMPAELAKQFGQLREVLSEIDDVDDRATIEQAVDDFEESLSGEEVNPDNARRRGRLLARLAESLGTAAVTTSVAELVKAALAAGLT
ncbi:hypothetical protein [Gordonia hongkongensis]|uniref:AbiTii domain-containing protein n=1 Tax=Gordonia hongkongensis TaxID=1701090 RepID=UPI001FF97326|nr:hypothetical protein [Gordonia hongkongensis]UPG70838.1 hypothetical protein MVF96_24430 [Gordonia hongkongensis]